MLAKENMSEFTATLRDVLDQINVEVKPNEDDLSEKNDDESNLEEILTDAQKKIDFAKKDQAERSLLKISLYTLVANICNDKTLR